MNEVLISNMFGFSLSARSFSPLRLARVFARPLSEPAYKKDIANHKLRDGSISAQFNL